MRLMTIQRPAADSACLRSNESKRRRKTIMSRLKGFRSRKTIFSLMAILLLVGSIATVVSLQPSALQSQQPSNLQGVAGLPGGGEDADLYAADPAKVSGESAQLTGIEDYWYTRVSYPTGQYDGRWLLQAAQQDSRVQEQVPAGRAAYTKGNSPLSLDPNSWTALGPQPLQMDGCLNCFAYGHVSGRVNDIRIDPVTPNVAYIAPVGGGVWKTTNCCSATTTWTPMTDSPLISTVSVDDLSIDPSDHNTIYVGT